MFPSILVEETTRPHRKSVNIRKEYFVEQLPEKFEFSVQLQAPEFG